MTTLQGFPTMSQLADTREVNRQFDCVPTCLAASLQYLLSEPFDGGAIKDVVYGASYVGATSASAYVAYCQQHGVKLAAIDSNPANLVVHIHQSIQQGIPVLCTVPDIYAPASYGWTHVLVAYEEEPGLLTMLDPYVGKGLQKSDSEWAQLLLNNEIWTLTKEETAITITINTPGVSAYFQQQDGQHWLCPATGRIIQYGILQAYCSLGNAGLCGLTLVGLPISNELPIGPNATKQFFERGCLVWDPAHAIDNPPGSGPVYLAHIYTDGPNGGTPPGQDPEIAVLQQELATAQNGSQLASLEQRLAQIKALATA